jgi:hypothetical protein
MRRELKTTDEKVLIVHRQIASDSETKWKRERRNQKTTGLEAAPVLKPKKAYILPTFSLIWPIAWGHITNGERVVLDSDTQWDQKTTSPEPQKFKCHRPLKSMTALKPPAIRYAHP